jgi:hypothetical protein
VPRRVLVRVAIRAGVACTLLAALFFMHGLSPAGGCPGGQSMSVSGAHSDSTLANGPAAATMSDTAARHSSMIGNAASAGVELGQVCVSRPPQLTPVGPLALTLLVAIIGLAAWAAWPYLLGSYARRRRRAPPSGRTLLHILCVSRT